MTTSRLTVGFERQEPDLKGQRSAGCSPQWHDGVWVTVKLRHCDWLSRRRLWVIWPIQMLHVVGQSANLAKCAHWPKAVWFKLTVTEMTINGNKSNPLTVTVTGIFLLTVTITVSEKNQLLKSHWSVAMQFIVWKALSPKLTAVRRVDIKLLLTQLNMYLLHRSAVTCMCRCNWLFCWICRQAVVHSSPGKSRSGCMGLCRETSGRFSRAWK